MPKQTLTYLKSKFSTGVKPSQDEFHDWLDSFVHKDDLAALNNTTIDARINNYDTSLRAVNANGTVDTLGDLFYVLRGFSDGDDIKTMLNNAGGAVSWGNIQNKPGSVNVTWEEQVVSLDNYLPPAPPVLTSVPSVAVSSFGSGALLQGATRFVIKDIYFSRMTFPTYATNLIAYPADRMRAVVFAVQPKVSVS